ncbi:MAG: tRNA (adenosine(37)-N6)-threonylcarbamoyltransferase complex ATPase subunit type 1 TsaE [Pseudomonadota bacterium]
MKLVLDDEAAMVRLGRDIAAVLSPDDRIGLVGDLGAGKTTLARAILRALADDPELEVPSPTFTIVQAYDGAIPVRHIDLYRLSDPSEALELGIGEPGAVELIEWPRENLPATLRIGFGNSDNARTVEVDGSAFAKRLSRRRAMLDFLGQAGWASASVVPLKQDASTRSYFRVTRKAERAVLMDAPSFSPCLDHYATRARLADGNNDAFLAVGGALRAAHLSAPAIKAADSKAGFLLLEDLGDDKIAVNGQPVAERYLAAADALAAFHENEVPAALPVPGEPGSSPPYRPPRFDADLAVFEVALFPAWYLGIDPPAEYEALWRRAIEALPRQDDRLALRDYHSPNCLWLGDREGSRRVGIIDFQDALFAPAAYDVASLAQDARVPIDDALEDAILARYLAGRPSLDEALFRHAYHVIGAQRAARISGVFRRLDKRDGKPHYLKYLPVVTRALAKNLAATDALCELAVWFEEHSDVFRAHH